MDITADKKWVHNPPKTKEQMYYRKIYEDLYPNTENCIPYFWMPKYVDTDDCSARTLDIYNNV
jgi:asparagine synthase (glutamine-hydrolysing)